VTYCIWNTLQIQLNLGKSLFQVIQQFISLNNANLSNTARGHAQGSRWVAEIAQPGPKVLSQVCPRQLWNLGQITQPPGACLLICEAGNGACNRQLRRGERCWDVQSAYHQTQHLANWEVDVTDGGYKCCCEIRVSAS
jgi:hypothetical protein